MVSNVLDELIKRVETLTPEEQLELIVYLAGKACQADQGAKPRRRWCEIYGAAPYPLVDEDAQDWVSRTRREADEQREKQWRHRL